MSPQYLQDSGYVTYLNPLYICVSVSFQTISGLEAQLSSLSEELQGAHAHHKQQLAETALLREEEKQRAFVDKEASLDRLRSDMERIRSDLERSHQQEKDAAQEKVGDGWEDKDGIGSVSNKMLSA